MVQIRACDVCYKKKIQCDVLVPGEPCNWCKHHNLTCGFTRSTVKRKRDRVKLSDVQRLQSRVEQLERSLAESREAEVNQNRVHSEPHTSCHVENGDAARLSDPPSSLVPTTTSPVTPRSRIPVPDVFTRQACFQGRYLGQNWYCKGIAVLSEKGQIWISSKSGKELAWSKLRLLCGNRCVTVPSLQDITSPETLLQLPPMETLQRTLEAFFASSFQSDCPIHDRALFEETIRIAYEAIDGPISSKIHISATACVLATLSLMCRLEVLANVLIGIDGDLCATKAQQLVRHITEDASIIDLQTLLLLQKHRTLTGQVHEATLLHATACRIVSAHGGHLYPPTNPGNFGLTPGHDRMSHIRKLFWLCYILDKEISLRFGQPPIFAEIYCDLTPPDNPLNSSAHEDIANNILRNIRLSDLKEGITRLLFSPQALKSTDAELLLHVRQLDNDLETWRLSIPLEYRPQLAVPNDPFIDTTTTDGVGRLTLQLEYHYLLTVIHTTVRRCGADISDNDDLPEDLHTVMHSSTDISLEASRSTLSLLTFSIDILPKEAVWSLVFYPVVAAMSLFTNILLHPLNMQSRLDVEVLQNVVGMIQNMPVDVMTRGDIRHMQALVEFIMELASHARSTVLKARGEILAINSQSV